MKVLEERDAAHVGTKTAKFRTEDIANSAEYRKAYEFAASVVAPEDQPFEHSPDGLIKHLGTAGPTATLSPRDSRCYLRRYLRRERC
jgi:hypothetical protein